MTFARPVHARSGVVRLGLLDLHAGSLVVLASVVSVDGHRSRVAAVRVTH